MDEVRTPLVTVITPTYNREVFLERTIDSILSQCYPNIEYIVIDDGSTDNTSQLLDKYQGQVRFESHANVGEQKTVNRGFSLAKGKYIAIVNSDDPLKANAISIAVNILENNPDLLAVYPDWDVVDENDQIIHNVRTKEFDYAAMLSLHDCIVGPGALITRQALEQVGLRNTDFRYVADFEFWLRLGLVGQMARIPQTLATWRRHDGAATFKEQGSEKASEHTRLINAFFQRDDLPAYIRKLKRKAMSWAHYVAAIHAGRNRLLRLKHVLMFILPRPISAWDWWQKMGSEKPGQNRIASIFAKLLGNGGS